MMKILGILILFLCVGLLPPVANANDIVGDIVAETAHQVFSEAERRIIRDYYAKSGQSGQHRDQQSGQHRDHKGNDRHKGSGKHGQGLPKGLTQQGGLPPGLQKQLDRNGRLPPGLEKKVLPGDLLGRLPPPPRGYERAIVDSHVVLVHTASQVLADIIVDIVYPD
ncbi:MAG: hypothetical protein WD572_12440 [Gammaproteobacteria bacterium]